MAADMIDSMAWLAYDEFSNQSTLKRGDRVRIREGYEGAGDTHYYIGKSVSDSGMVLIARTPLNVSARLGKRVLAAAIEPYPYSREERIERAIEDFIALTEWTVPLSADDGALLFAILDEGV
jgi:hypothetical protein